jgi:hypothetical protein
MSNRQGLPDEFEVVLLKQKTANRAIDSDATQARHRGRWLARSACEVENDTSSHK